MSKEQALLKIFRTYLTLSQRIKEGSKEGDLDVLEELLAERSLCQQRIDALFEDAAGDVSREDWIHEMIQIVDTAKGLNEQANGFLKERRKALTDAFGHLCKGKKVASSYQPHWETLHEASFFDKKS